MQPQPPPSSSSYQEASAALAARSAVQAAQAGSAADGVAGVAAAANVIIRHQAAGASLASSAGSLMLAEQGTPVAPVGVLNPVAFTTQPEVLAAMIETVDREAEDLWTSWQFSRLAASLVQDAGRVAQQVDIASRPGVGYVRQLTPPSCSRCAVLAGRIYRWNADFNRHPGCDCTATPTTDPDRLVQDPAELAAQGMVTGLSKADRQALAAGADFNQVANAKRGMRTATVYGRRVQVTTEGTTRRGIAYKRLNARFGAPDARASGERYFRTTSVRLTPNEIFRQADDQQQAIHMLKLHGYIL